MRQRTLQATYSLIVGTTPVEVLGPNPRRKAFLFGPLAPSSGGGGQILAAQFAAGGGQSWVVPTGVTLMAAAYVWGAGGLAGFSGGGLGGGGAGGGGFAASGPQVTVPGQTWGVVVDGGGGGSVTTVKTPANVVVAGANSGGSGSTTSPGVGGLPTDGLVLFAGAAGADATALAGAGGGGGGAGGYGSVGTTGAGQVGGAGGGSAGLLGFGIGGSGSAGGDIALPAPGGGTPGGGIGGPGDGASQNASPGSGAAVIFYYSPVVSAILSLSRRGDVAAGFGAVNWIPGFPYPLTLSDDCLGTSICEPWYLVSSVAGTVVQITEYSYEPDAIEPAF